jgi:probable rRNA maturation factor
MPTKRRKPRASRGKSELCAVRNDQRRVRLDVTALERFVLRVNRELGLGASSAFIRFVTDVEMARLNQTFRKKLGTTDVLSFPSEIRSRPTVLQRRVRALDGAFLGDIAISPIVARRNAKAFGRTMTQEICILMLHGLLHLLGYDHETDRGEMERVEARLRRRLELAG